MKLTPVKSGNVAAVGFEGGVIHVHFHDGAVYSQPCEESMYRQLLLADSKGKFIRQYLRDLKRIGEVAAPVVPSQEPVDESAKSMEMQIDDECCSPHFVKAALAGTISAIGRWECPKCGTDWMASELNADGGIRMWKPIVKIDILAGRRR